jgi:hypothetical protein
MFPRVAFASLITLLCVGVSSAQTTQVSREDWGAPPVTVAHAGGVWTIAGKKQTVSLNDADLALRIKSGPTEWAMVPSSSTDLQVRTHGRDVSLRLADASAINITPFDTGFKTGVKLLLDHWRTPTAGVDLPLYLTVALEGPDEDLVFDIAATETDDTVVRQLDWPTALDAREIDYTLLSNYRGVLLPRIWPKPYFPIRATNPDGSAKASDISIIQSNIIESWSMSWWGFVKGSSAMMVIVETPDDAGYQFDHPAGGPTVIGPRWRTSLGKLRYPRAARMCFFPHGNHVDLAKRYRRYAMDAGLFVSLKEKIAQRPIVKQLIGTPMTRMGILTDITRDSLRYSTTQPEKNHHMVSFDDRAAELRKYKDAGLDRLCVVLTGWPHEGYDRQHPDEIPPAPAAGGYEGMKRLEDACNNLGYLFSLHDQYRDYYVDAPSYDPQFAIHEEDVDSPAQAFAGSRFGQWKKGQIPFMNNWDGGTQAYLNNRYMPGHLIKNYDWLFAHGIHPQGIYLDVFGYIGPDEDFNPEHPTTRTEARRARELCYTWSKNHLGFIGTEAACDWTVPYSDFSSPLRSNKGVAVPLFNLVYHDAIITPYMPDDLRGFLNGGLPQIPAKIPTTEELATIRRMAALHERLALTEMTNHEFLDDKRRRERTTFSDGTTVTVDWDDKSVQIQPDVEAPAAQH